MSAWATVGDTRPAGGQSGAASSPQQVVAAYARLDQLARGQQRDAPAPLTLARMRALVRALGDPQHRYPSIHVTGTNGKGSTATMITNLLSSHGWRVGRYTSPHLHDLTERVVIGDRSVSELALASAVERVLKAARDVAITPTWFEAITAAALWIFAEQAVEVAVIEAGRLGRWDATNVVDGEVAVVTNVELDHTDIAGHSRSAIAHHKAGIVKPGCTLVLGEPDPSLREQFVAEQPGRLLTLGEELAIHRRRVDQGGSLVDLQTPWGVHRDVRVGMLGEHQCRNALLAVAAVEAFTGAALATGAGAVLSRTQLPGRLQTIHSEPLVLVDGAHNPAAAAALRKVLDESFGTPAPRILLYGTLAERDPALFLHALRIGKFDAAVTTEPPSPRAASPIAVGAAILAAHVTSHVVTPVARALSTAQTLAGRSGLVVATGSIYLAAALATMPRTEACPPPSPELSEV